MDYVWKAVEFAIEHKGKIISIAAAVAALAVELAREWKDVKVIAEALGL